MRPADSSPKGLAREVLDALCDGELNEKSTASYRSFLEADFPQMKKISTSMSLMGQALCLLEGVSDEVPHGVDEIASEAAWAFVQSRSIAARSHQEFHDQTHQAMIDAMSGDEGVLLLEEPIADLAHHFDEASVWLESRTGETLFTQALGGFSQILSDNIERSQAASGVPDSVTIVDEAAVDWIQEVCQDLVDYLTAINMLFPSDDDDDASPPALQDSLDALIEDLG